MTQSLKKHFLELLLTELTKMVSLKEAKIVSLAGSGIEARLWREKGVPAQNAWLIDSNPAVIRTMLKKQNQHPYHLYRGMAYTFPAVLYAHYRRIGRALSSAIWVVGCGGPVAGPGRGQ